MPSKPEELNEASASLASGHLPPENSGIWQSKAVTYSTSSLAFEMGTSSEREGHLAERDRKYVWAQGVKPDININSRLSLPVPDWQGKGRTAPPILPDSPAGPLNRGLPGTS